MHACNNITSYNTSYRSEEEEELLYRSFDDGFHYYMSGHYNESNFVYVDPHVLSSPTLVDVNGDGNIEVIMAISYYFDSVEYKDKKVDFEPGNYVAGGIVCWDLKNQDWSWMVHLDLTTDKTQYQAMIYGTPTVADLEADGRMEVRRL